ncbi:cell differentiation protein RCD1 homolog isoform X4 [Asparagus officinalis]|uniref:cell differentiation protein RCD1 homolog isoform X4 n=1 Tax=Asparagus officinalis TaxID=4686 RepID=UPI00098E23FC|nr:cell differentiation protein RCD1 homolog isoform X4 [Asparagus officinalis]
MSDNPPLFGSQQASPHGREGQMASLEQLVLDLCDRDLRENALLELLKKRVIFQDLAPLLWHSCGTIAALLQCVASHPDTRILFLNAHMPLYLYPFLNATSKTKPFEYLRLTSLGVIGALVKVGDTEVIGFLLQTEIIPLCLRTMENGSALSKTVATFIVQNVLLDDIGLRYICATAERFFAVIQVLSTMIESLSEQPSMRLLKYIIRCCLRLSDNPRACEALQDHLPKLLTDRTFDRCLREDPLTCRWLQQLLLNVYGELGAQQLH